MAPKIRMSWFPARRWDASPVEVVANLTLRIELHEGLLSGILPSNIFSTRMFQLSQSPYLPAILVDALHTTQAILLITWSFFPHAHLASKHSECSQLGQLPWNCGKDGRQYDFWVTWVWISLCPCSSFLSDEANFSIATRTFRLEKETLIELFKAKHPTNLGPCVYSIRGIPADLVSDSKSARSFASATLTTFPVIQRALHLAMGCCRTLTTSKLTRRPGSLLTCFRRSDTKGQPGGPGRTNQELNSSVEHAFTALQGSTLLGFESQSTMWEYKGRHVVHSISVPLEDLMWKERHWSKQDDAR